jgi:HK97 family phage portal protein
VLGGIIPWQSHRDVTKPLSSGTVIGMADGKAPIYKAVIPKFLYKPPYGYPRFVDIPELRRLAATPYVSMCINTIIDEIAAIPWDIVPREDLDTPQGEETSNPVEHIKEVKEFLNNPNVNKENFNIILRRLLKDILELDSAVLVKVFNQKGELCEIYARDGGTVTMNPDIYGTFQQCDEIVPTWQLASKDKEEYEEYMKKKPAYFQYGWITGARPMPFGTREIIYMMRNPRTDSIYGRSSVEILMDTIQLLIYGQDANLDYFTDNNIPKGVFRMIGATSDDVKAFKEQWQTATKLKNEVGDWRKRWWHMPILNVDGNFERIQFSNDELQLISQQEWFTKMVWANFGVTPSELGYTKDSNKATEIVQSKVFRRKAIRPILQLLEHHLNTELIWQEFYEDVKFSFDTDDLAENLDKAELYEKYLKNGIKSINEVREEMGLPPVEDGDKHKGTGNDFNPFEQQNNNPFQEEDNEEEDKKKDTKSIDIETLIKTQLKQQEKIILNLLKQTLPGKSKIEQIKALDNTLIKKIIGILSLDSINEGVKSNIRTAYLEGHEQGEKAVNRNVQYNNNAVTFLEDYTFDNVKDISEEIKNDLRQELQRGIMSGEPYSKISERVKHVFDVHDSRAKAISVTEITRAENAGMNEAIKSSGVKGKKKWVSVIDNKTSPICKALNGTMVGINDKFEYKGEEYDYPPAHVQCRSKIVFVPET